MKRSLMFLFALVVSLAMLFTTQSTTATGPAPAPRPQSDPSIVGAWGPVTNLNSISSGAIVAIHTSLLPNGKVLVFTRQQASDGNDNVNGFSRTYVWDPATNSVVSEAFNGTTNLFCSGHAFIHDGRLLVTGGHLGGDLRGEPDANFYDWNTGAWSSAASMGRGRWYPTNVALGNSEMLVDAGFDEFQQITSTSSSRSIDSRRCGRRTTRGGHSPRRWTLTAIPTHGSTLLRTGRCSIPAPRRRPTTCAPRGQGSGPSLTTTG